MWQIDSQVLGLNGRCLIDVGRNWQLDRHEVTRCRGDGLGESFKPCSNNSNGHVVSRRISMVPGDWCFVDRDMRSSGAHMDESNFKSSMTDYRNATKITAQRAVAQGYLVQNTLQGTPSYHR